MNILPYPLDYSAPYSFDKCGKYRLTATSWFKGKLTSLGTLPQELEEARRIASGVGNTFEDHLKMVRDYISKAEAFNQTLIDSGEKYEMRFEWSSYYNEKKETITNLDIEKAMLLILLVFKFIDRCRVANHLEPILTGSSLGQKRLDNKLITETINNYKIAKEILSYILDLNIEESKFPELNKIYLKGLLYYIQGLQLIFVGYKISYGDQIAQVSLGDFIEDSIRYSIRFDDGNLARYYSTAAEFLIKANNEFNKSQVQANTSVKVLCDPLNDGCCLLMYFYKSMGFLLYGIPTIDLYEYNSVNKENNIPKLKTTFDTTMTKLNERLKYIKKVKSEFIKVLHSSLYTRNSDVTVVVDYYKEVIDKVESSFKDRIVNEEPDPIYNVDELKKEPTPMVIAKALITGCRFCGYELTIPSSMIELPKACGITNLYNESIELLFPDILNQTK